ncbi:short-chain dehydrogenase [bacterium M21]|nr:short-chain dehydrogenase [bacterium M21]
MAILDKFNMTGKVACVTGASQGLGKCAAIGLAEAGANVVIADINIEAAEKAAEEISALGVKCIAVKTDVTSPDSVNALMDKIISEFGTLDVMFNNAGIAEGGNAEEMPLDVWQRTIDVNLTGVFICAQAAGKIMLEKGKGSIINMASMSGKIINDTHNVCNYHAAKNGVVALTRSMAAEWAPRNVRVNAISPGYHKSEMAMQFESLFEKWTPNIPMGRLGDVEEIQGLVLFLASDASTYMTGSDIITDGGYTLW